MVTAEDRIHILTMLQEGKITPESAAQLLDAMGEGSSSRAEAIPSAPEEVGIVEEPGRKPRWLHVRVTDSDSGRRRVNVRLPIGLVSLGMKLGAKYAPEIEGIDMDALIQAAQSGNGGAFVDVYDEEDGEHVEVFLE